MARVSVTAAPSTATGFVSARLASTPFTVTVKSPASGSESGSSASLKVRLSAVAFTVGVPTSLGAIVSPVTFVAGMLKVAAARLPARSCSGLAFGRM